MFITGPTGIDNFAVCPSSAFTMTDSPLATYLASNTTEYAVSLYFLAIGSLPPCVFGSCEGSLSESCIHCVSKPVFQNRSLGFVTDAPNSITKSVERFPLRCASKYTSSLVLYHDLFGAVNMYA